MFKLWFRITTGAAAMGLALVSTGCDDSMNPTAPAGPEPSASPEVRLLRAPHSTAPDGASFYLTGQQADSVVAIVGPLGGKLKIRDHELEIPANAVNGPTRFVIKDDQEGLIGVGLSATSCASWACEINERGSRNDVGAQGFPVPLALELSYQGALVLNEDNLKVYYLLGGTANGPLEPQPSTVDKVRKKVKGNIDHFSRYAVGEN